METPISDSRRHFLKTTGALMAIPALGGLLAACGGGADAPLPTVLRHTGTSGVAKGEVDRLLALTASEAVTAIANRSLSAVDYVTVLLDRAEILWGLRSLISLNRGEAIAAAQRIDDAVRAGSPLGPLAGLPVIVKDNINTVDLPTTGGTPALERFRPASNAPVLQTLLDAGAIMIGKANMHELAFGITNTNFSPFAGAARNPYDQTRIPGGSSGGSGAAVAARIAPVALGSDTGGSVRVPAAFNGIVGLRPSVGNGGQERRYSTAGVLPISHTRDTVGPLGRTVADVALIDAVITGTPVPVPATLQGLRFGVPPVLWSDLDNDVAAVVQAARARLASAGVLFVEADLPGLMELNAKIGFPIALHEPIEDIPAYLAASGATGISLEDIAAQIASPDVKGAFQAVVTDAQGAAYPDAINVFRPQLQDLFASYFVDHQLDAIFFPTVPVPPPVIDFVNGSSTISINGGPPVDEFTTVIRNVDPDSNAGLPGLSLPAGLTPDGLPVGMEIDGPVGSDKKLLAIGMAMEAVFGTLPAPNV